MLVTGAVRARDVATVLRKVLEAVRRLDDQVVALVALKIFNIFSTTALPATIVLSRHVLLTPLDGIDVV